MNLENPYLNPVIIENLAKIGSGKDVGRMRQMSTNYNQLQSSIYFDKLKKVFCIYEETDGSVFTYIKKINQDVKKDQELLPPFNNLTTEVSKIFRKLEVSFYSFDKREEKFIGKLATLLNPYITEIEFNFDDHDTIPSEHQELEKFTTNVNEFINLFHKVTTIRFTFQLRNVDTIKTIIQNVRSTTEVVWCLTSFLDLDIDSKFNLFPNVNFDVVFNNKLTYEDFLLVSQFCLRNIDKVKARFDFDLSETTFPEDKEECFRNTLCQLSEKINGLSFKLTKENENAKFRNTLDSIKLPILKFLSLTNYPNASQVLNNCPNVEEFILDVEQSSCIFIDNQKTDKENLANFLGVNRGNLLCCKYFEYYYSEEDKITPGSELEKYLKSLFPSVIKFKAESRRKSFMEIINYWLSC